MLRLDRFKRIDFKVCYKDKLLLSRYKVDVRKLCINFLR